MSGATGGVSGGNVKSDQVAQVPKYPSTQDCGHEAVLAGISPFQKRFSGLAVVLKKAENELRLMSTVADRTTGTY